MAVGGAAMLAGYVGLLRCTAIEPPDLPAPQADPLRYDGPVTRSGRSFLARRGRLWVLGLSGPAIRIGFDHGRLESPLMAEGDATMQALYARYVPSRLARGLIDLFVRAKNRNLDESFPPARRAEVFGESLGYRDRFSDWMPTYQRLVYLHGLYDISLAFEESPLLACTSFFAAGPTTADGHAYVGRNFDFDVDAWFDRDKVVQLVRADGAIPYVAVGWPGMTGVVTGLNAEGVWVAVHGARGGEREGQGTPVVFTTREVLERARTLEEAIGIVLGHRPMVPHLIVLADGDDAQVAVVERAPGVEARVLRGRGTMPIANHYRTAPLRDDPRNRAVRDRTSSVARHARMQELLHGTAGQLDATRAASLLRDRAAPGGSPRPLGHRAAIDGLLAAHGVVADLTARTIWVSEGPHLLGRFVRFDVGALRTDAGLSAQATAPDTGAIGADPILGDGTWARVRLGARWREEAARLRAAGDLDAARSLLRRALALRRDDHEAWRALAELEDEADRSAAARAAWARFAALDPPSPEQAREARRRARP